MTSQRPNISSMSNYLASAERKKSTIHNLCIKALSSVYCVFSTQPCAMCVFDICVCISLSSDLSLSRSALSRLLQAILPVDQLTFSTIAEKNIAGVSTVLGERMYRGMCGGFFF